MSEKIKTTVLLILFVVSVVITSIGFYNILFKDEVVGETKVPDTEPTEEVIETVPSDENPWEVGIITDAIDTYSGCVNHVIAGELGFGDNTIQLQVGIESDEDGWIILNPKVLNSDKNYLFNVWCDNGFIEYSGFVTNMIQDDIDYDLLYDPDIISGYRADYRDEYNFGAKWYPDNVKTSTAIGIVVFDYETFEFVGIGNIIIDNSNGYQITEISRSAKLSQDKINEAAEYLKYQDVFMTYAELGTATTDDGIEYVEYEYIYPEVKYIDSCTVNELLFYTYYDEWNREVYSGRLDEHVRPMKVAVFTVDDIYLAMVYFDKYGSLMGYYYADKHIIEESLKLQLGIT